MSEHRLVFGMDIGGTRTKYGLIDLTQKAIMAQQTALVQSAVRTSRALCEQAGFRITEIIGGGIGVPGYVDGDDISMEWETISVMEGNTCRTDLQAAQGFEGRRDTSPRTHPPAKTA